VAALLEQQVDGLSDRKAAGLAVDAVQRMKSEVGIPLRLRDIGIEEKALPALAEAALGITRLIRANPRTLDGEALVDILGRAW
jgi:alcohol dehydrogenase class IV